MDTVQYSCGTVVVWRIRPLNLQCLVLLIIYFEVPLAPFGKGGHIRL